MSLFFSTYNAMFFSLLGDGKEPIRKENRQSMDDDGAARLKERRFRVEEWNRL